MPRMAISQPAPEPEARPAPKAAPKPAVAPRSIPVGGAWKLQLGAFGVASNVESLWNKVKAMPEIAGHPRATVPAGKVTRLLATGYSEEAAQGACRKLVGAGLSCLVVKD